MAEGRIPASRITVRLTYKDAPVDLELEGASIRDVEDLISATLKRTDWRTPRPALFGARKPQTPPFYDGDGNACCPHHTSILKERPFGWCCQERLRAGDPLANERGYCKYVWKDGK